MTQTQIHSTRRYVSSRETMGYVLFDSAKTIHIEKYNSRYLLDVLKIDLRLNSLAAFINGIWDIINDSFVGFLVDKSATRWGKFRPFLMVYTVLGTVVTSLFYMLPLFFNTNPYHISKFIFYLIMLMMNDMNKTLRDISETGLLGTITQNPQDRVRLYTQAEVISAIWENIPDVLMGLMIDLINHQVIQTPMRSVYVGAGTICAFISGVLAFYFAVVARERVVPTSHEHSYKEGLRSIVNNRPMLLILFSELTTALSLRTEEQNYFIDVLGSASIANIIILPGMPLSFVSYTYFQRLHNRFSTKTLWIFGQHLKDLLSLCVFAFGSIGGVKNGLYRQIRYMLPAFMFKDILYKSTLSINKIPPREVLTDALDYCEWKNGYRSEGITLSTKGMIVKLVKNVIGSFNSMIMKRIGYSLDAGFGQQSDRTKYGLFALCLVLPGLTGLLSVIPKLFYDLSGKKRERMYEELSIMRAEKRKVYDSKQAMNAAE